MAPCLMALRDDGVDACLPRGPRFGRIGGGGEETASGLLECRDAGWIGQSEVEADDRRREFDQDGKHPLVLDDAAADFVKGGWGAGVIGLEPHGTTAVWEMVCTSGYTSVVPVSFIKKTS